jgi:hypothetical protein
MKTLGREAFSSEQDLKKMELLKGSENSLFYFFVQNIIRISFLNLEAIKLKFPDTKKTWSDC